MTDTLDTLSEDTLREKGVLPVFLYVLDREITSKYLFVSKMEGTDEKYKAIMFELIDLYLKYSLHTLYLPSTLERISDYVHSTTHIREFMIEVIDKLYVLLGKDVIVKYCENLCTNLRTFHSANKNLYIGPYQYIDSLYFNPDLHNVDALIYNHWLLFMTLHLMSFDQSNHFLVSYRS